jgi:hypothetical protein
VETAYGTTKLAWEPPATVTLTDTDGRTDQPDIAIRNAVSAISPTG